MAVPHTVGAYIAWRESAEDVFLTVIKDFVAGLPTAVNLVQGRVQA